MIHLGCNHIDYIDMRPKTLIILFSFGYYPTRFENVCKVLVSKDLQVNIKKDTLIYYYSFYKYNILKCVFATLCHKLLLYNKLSHQQQLKINDF